MRTHANWTFVALLVVMLQAISVYIAAALVLPDVTGDAIVDLRGPLFRA
jgi:phage shock protein PspC (stress-responsive transcriptional regulator)